MMLKFLTAGLISAWLAVPGAAQIQMSLPNGPDFPSTKDQAPGHTTRNNGVEEIRSAGKG